MRGVGGNHKGEPNISPLPFKPTRPRQLSAPEVTPSLLVDHGAAPSLAVEPGTCRVAHYGRVRLGGLSAGAGLIAPAGSRPVKVVPPPAVLSTVISAPIIRASLRLIAKPEAAPSPPRAAVAARRRTSPAGSPAILATFNRWPDHGLARFRKVAVPRRMVRSLFPPPERGSFKPAALPVRLSLLTL